jgi:hypothetical protein
MLFASLLRRLNRVSGTKQKSPPRPRRVPRVEYLEDRSLPSVLTVTSAADNGSAGTLRFELAAARPGDTIQFAHQLSGQTITLTQGQLTISENLTIAGPGASRLAISGNAAGRIFDVTSGVTATVSGLTLTNGLSTDGAAVLNAGSLTLSQDVFSANEAQGIAGSGLFGDGAGRGGAVENQSGASLHVVHSTFTDNEALGGAGGGNAFGGAIYNAAGTVTVSQGTFTGNQALAADGGSVGTPVTLPGGEFDTLLGDAGGGAIWNDGGSLNVSNSSLSSNTAAGGDGGNATGSTAAFPDLGNSYGGAIGSGEFFTTATPNVAIAGSTLSGNQSLAGTNLISSSGAGSGNGGAVAGLAGNLSVSASSVTGNLAESGALLTILQDGVVSEVTAGDAAGGGIFYTFVGVTPAVLPSFSVTNSTVNDNQALGVGPNASGFAGGMLIQDSNAQVINSTLSGNQAIGGPGGGYSVFYSYHTPLGGGLGQGGAIFSASGPLTVSGCTVSNNLAEGGSGGGSDGGSFGGSGVAGGISATYQQFDLVNSTLSGNQALGGNATAGSGYFPGGSGGGALGGAVFLEGDSAAYAAGGSATISGSSFTGNLARGGAGFNTGSFYGFSLGNGGGASGGAVDVFDSTSLQLSGSTFTADEAVGGAGGNGGSGFSGSPGGGASGGGVALGGPTATVSDCTFSLDVTQGGAGGADGGAGGNGVGGALSNSQATTSVSNSSFVLNVAVGGAGGSGANGGDGRGGAAFNNVGFAFGGSPVSSLTFTNSSFALNEAIGGAGGSGANGGNGLGGGIFSTLGGSSGQSILAISGCTLAGNLAAGGAGGSGANGGNGQGGGLYVGAGATATVQTSVIVGNVADGGAAGSGGSAGQGVGGGIYNLGTLNLDALSIVMANFASTSNDNIFG